MSNKLIDVSQFKLHKHPAMTLSSDMRSIINPLRSIGITHLGYQRIYPGHISSILTTDPTFLEVFIREKFYKHALFGSVESYKPGYHYIDQSNAILKTAEEVIGTRHYLSIIQKKDYYCEMFYFASTLRDKRILNLYMNERDFFYRFCQYFQEHGAPLIQEAEKALIYSGEYRQETILPTYNQEKFDSVDTGAIFQRLALAQYPSLDPSVLPFHLSQREMTCIPYIMEGFSAKEIARKLQLSPRTVEKYIESIKQKSGCSSLPKLVHALYSSNL